MINWFVEKENKIPLYLQLKDLIKYYISTGVIKDHQQLPGVNELARELDINFDTVRKAYKELEKEGLVSMKRGTGTFVNLRDAALPDITSESHPELDPLESARILIRRMLRQGMALSAIEKLMEQAIAEVSRDVGRQYLIFTECNALQVGEISAVLEEQLNLKVRPVLLSELEEALKSLPESDGELLAIITSGFHVPEVQSLLGDRRIDVHMLVTNMSPDTRRSLDEVRGKAHFGFICRDQKSVPFYTDLLRSELGREIELSSSILADETRVQAVLEKADVLLVTPPVFEEIRRRVPKNKPVFNVFDRIDPMSLKMLKDNMFRKNRG
jgi:GntR family transcriptional regulator